MFAKLTAAAAVLLLAGSSLAGQYRVEARFSEGANLTSGKSRYQERSRGNLVEKRFKIEVEDAAAGETLDITLNGMPFGSVTANDLGVAELNFRSVVDDNPTDPNESVPFPDNFPRINAGDTITVGTMSGTYQLR